MRPGSATVALALLLLGATPAEEPLVVGIRQVKEGAFEDGILTLDVAVREMASTAGRSPDLAQAYVHLGVAYLGLGQETIARAKFRTALKHRTDLRLGRDEFSPRVIRVFEAARSDESSSARLQREAKRKRGKGGLIALGIGGAAAGGIVAAVSRERSNEPPTVSVSLSPEGSAILNVTTMTFTARASDPEADPLTYQWTFGDGGTATGRRVFHVFTSAGTHSVHLRVDDGLDTTEATASVTVGSLRGPWRPNSPVWEDVAEISFFSDAPDPGVQATFADSRQGFGIGAMTDPRNVNFFYEGRGGQICQYGFRGQATPDLGTISGILSCFHSSSRLLCSACDGQRVPLTLTRR